MKQWIVLLPLLSCALVQAENWPQFRGPGASGQTEGNKATPITWDVETGKKVRWKIPIPGLAHSSPIIWGDRVYALTAVGPTDADLKTGIYGNIQSVENEGEQTWQLIALNKQTGDILWNTSALKRQPRVKRHQKATHCNSTPAADGRNIVALLGSEGLFCFSPDGKLRWQKDLGPMDAGYFRNKSAQWGFASSPIIHEDTVIVQCDVQENSFLAAFNIEDGNELWRTDRDDVPTWSTPAVHTTPDRTQIIVNGWHHIGGYDFATGREIWSLDGGGDIPVPTPIFGHGFVYLTSAHGRFRPMRAVRLDATGDITPPAVGETNKAIAWVHPRKGNYMQTPILVGELLFGCSDLGIVSCFDAQSGKLHYEERLEKSRNGFTASPVYTNGNLYYTSENGDVYVVPATNKFSVRSINPLGETCLATPAISDGTLYFRTRHHLIAIGEDPTSQDD